MNEASATSEFLSALNAGCDVCRIKDCRLLVAVSGGADSVALLLGLALLRENQGITLVVAHLNHQLRGCEADTDAQWVEQLCREHNIPCVIGVETVATSPELSKQGLEGAARSIRREFLRRVAIEQQCAGIAVAHTANDQAETILHHILRGTGLAGLRGMHEDQVAAFPNNGPVPFIRPLLRVDRILVERFLAERSQSYRTDSTNSDTTLTRNRIRHELMPLLAREFNPQIQSALLRLGRQVQDVYEQELALARHLLASALIEATPTHCRLRCSAFDNQPANRIRESFALLWRQQDWPRQQMGFDDWNRLVTVLEPDSSAIMLPGGIHVQRRGELLMVERSRHRSA